MYMYCANESQTYQLLQHTLISLIYLSSKLPERTMHLSLRLLHNAGQKLLPKSTFLKNPRGHMSVIFPINTQKSSVGETHLPEQQNHLDCTLLLMPDVVSKLIFVCFGFVLLCSVIGTCSKRYTTLSTSENQN